MRRYRVVFWLVVAAIPICFLVGRHWSEPADSGRPVSAWLRDLQHPAPLVRHRAQEAVRRIGTNALPQIRSMFSARDSAVLTNVVGFLQRQPWVRIPFTSARQRRISAGLACVELGPAAQPLIPDLLVFSQGDTFCENLAESALAKIGAAAVPSLVVLLTNADFHYQSLAMGALVEMRAQARTAVPSLLAAARDEHISLREGAVRALGRSGAADPVVVRALVDALGDPEQEVRWAAESAFRCLGGAALPALRPLLESADPTFQHHATNALEQVEVAIQAEAAADEERRQDSSRHETDGRPAGRIEL